MSTKWWPFCLSHSVLRALRFEQSGTKPNLVAKILSTKFGVFFVIMFSKILKYDWYESNDNAIKYYGSVIPHDWEVSFEKFGGLPTVVVFL